MNASTPDNVQPIVLADLRAAAAEAGNLDERGVPKKLGRQYRRVEKAAYDKTNRTVTMAVSSSTPVDRWFGSEILSHDKGAIRTDRLTSGVSLLFNHDYDQLLGRSQTFDLGDPIRVTSRFGTSELAVEKERDVEAEILVDVSIGYQVYEWEITEDKNGVRTYLAVDWEILEVSLVTVPADPTVGVGRDVKDGVPVKVRSFTRAAKEDAETDPDDDEDGDDEDGDDDDNDNGSKPARSTQPTTTRTAPMELTTVTIDLKAQEQARVASLRSIRTAYPAAYTEEALFADISGDAAPANVKERIADAIIKGQERNAVKTIADEVFDGMNERERNAYSLRNVYCAAVNQRSPGTFKGKEYEAGFEREVGETLRKAAGERGITGLGAGIPVPSATTRSLHKAQQELKVRALASGGNAGAETNFVVVEADPIELLRSRTVCLALGARMMTGLKGAYSMPKQNAAGQSNWLLETAPATETDPTLTAITMSPHRLSMFNAYYLDFLAQSRLAVDSFLADDRMNVLVRSLDTAGLAGTGVAPVPKGLLNQTGLAAVLAGSTRAANGTVTAGAGGTPLTFVDYNNLEAAIATANGDIGTMGFVMSPKVRASGRSTPQIPGTASGFVFPNSKVGPSGIQEGPLGYNTIATSNTALTGFTANSVSGLHAVILGVWDQMMFGDWGLSEVIADPYTGAASALYNITEHAFYDTQVRHVESFAACTSALPS